MSKQFHWIFLLAAVWGTAGETMLFMHSQCRRIGEILAEDFRVMAFLPAEAGPVQAAVVEEHLRAVGGVADARFISRDAALEALKAQDPTVESSVALLGENPLNPLIEVRLIPEMIMQVDAWTAAASKVPDVQEVQYKRLQVDAIAQAQFYKKFLELAMALTACLWLGGAAAGLKAGAEHKDSTQFAREILRGAFVGALGSAVGAGLVYLAALPLQVQARLWTWPLPGSQAILILGGVLGPALWREWRSAQRGRGEDGGSVRAHAPVRAAAAHE